MRACVCDLIHYFTLTAAVPKDKMNTHTWVCVRVPTLVLAYVPSRKPKHQNTMTSSRRVSILLDLPIVRTSSPEPDFRLLEALMNCSSELFIVFQPAFRKSRLPFNLGVSLLSDKKKRFKHCIDTIEVNSKFFPSIYKLSIYEENSYKNI